MRFEEEYFPSAQNMTSSVFKETFNCLVKIGRAHV